MHDIRCYESICKCNRAYNIIVYSLEYTVYFTTNYNIFSDYEAVYYIFDIIVTLVSDLIYVNLFQNVLKMVFANFPVTSFGNTVVAINC